MRLTDNKVIFLLSFFLFCSNIYPQLITNKPEFKNGYLFSHMTKDDYGRLFYAISRDGLNWLELNDGKRIIDSYKGHPDITLGHNGRFYLIGNPEKEYKIRIWVSDDLINWEIYNTFSIDHSNLPKYNSEWSGAPKIFYDKAEQQYIVTYHVSTIDRKNEAHASWDYWDNMRTLYTTSKDLKTWTKAKRLLPFDIGTIDIIIRKDGDKYFAIMKDERAPDFTWTTGKSIRISSAPNIEGPWTKPGPTILPSYCEAPAAIPRPDGVGWFIYAERYHALNYELATASTLNGTWYQVHRHNFKIPFEAKHGGMIMITNDQYEKLLKHFGASIDQKYYK